MQVLAKEFKCLLNNAFRNEGFAGTTNFYKPIDNDWYAGMSVAIGKWYGFYWVNCNIGIQWVPVERLCATCMGYKYNKQFMSYGYGVKDATGAKLDLKFSDSDGAAKAVEVALHMWREKISPYLCTMANEREAERKVKIAIGMMGGNPERYATILKHTNQHDKLEAFLNDFGEGLVAMDPECYHQEWEPFVSRLKFNNSYS
jgi:hypothetical protein